LKSYDTACWLIRSLREPQNEIAIRSRASRSERAPSAARSPFKRHPYVLSTIKEQMSIVRWSACGAWPSKGVPFVDRSCARQARLMQVESHRLVMLDTDDIKNTPHKIGVTASPFMRPTSADDRPKSGGRPRRSTTPGMVARTLSRYQHRIERLCEQRRSSSGRRRAWAARLEKSGLPSIVRFEDDSGGFVDSYATELHI